MMDFYLKNENIGKTRIITHSVSTEDFHCKIVLKCKPFD